MSWRGVRRGRTGRAFCSPAAGLCRRS
jgi:hypothetical protein